MDYLRLAQVLRPQGLKGEIKLKPFVNDVNRFLELDYIYLELRSGHQCRRVVSVRIYKQFIYLQIEGITNYEQAEALRGCMICIDRAHAIPLEEGAHYIADIEGLEVFDEAGRVLGTLSEVLQTGGVDVYFVKGDSSFSFPAIDRVIVDIDIEGGRMTLNSEFLKEVCVYA